MALEDIVTKIREDAKAEAARIIEEAQSKADSILNDAGKRCDRLKNEALNEARQKAEDVKRRLFTLAELEIRKELLAAKQQVIQAAFDKAITGIQNMDKPKYLALLKKMILQSATREKGILTVGPHDLDRIDASFLDDVNKDLSAKGKASIELSPKAADISGGFIIKTGQIEINNTIDAALKLTREEIEPTVAGILFKE